MAVTRRSDPLPLPAAELVRMKAYLASDYGAQVWGEGKTKVLVIRVPRDEPDLVLDTEAAVERLDPSDLQVQVVVLAGNTTTLVIPPHVLEPSLRDRLALDRKELARLRNELKPGQWVQFVAQGDVRKSRRIAVRLSCATVGSVEDQELDQWADKVGPELPNLGDALCAYLLANQDEIRLDADVLLQDITRRYEDEARRQAAAQAAAEAAAAEKLKRDQERRQLLADMASRIGRKVMAAPLNRLAPSRWEAGAGGSRGWTAPSVTPVSAAGAPRAASASSAPSRSIGSSAPDAMHASGIESAGSLSTAPPAANLSPGRAAMYGAIDRLPGGPGLSGLARRASAPVREDLPVAAGRPAAESDAPYVPAPATPSVVGSGLGNAIDSILQEHGMAAPSGVVPDNRAATLLEELPVTRQAPTIDPSAVAVAQLVERLQKAGYEVLEHPNTGHAIDLAAEREDYPSRIIARFPSRFTVDVASDMLAAAKATGADLALVVSDDADAAARQRIIATKARHVMLAELRTMAL